MSTTQLRNETRTIRDIVSDFLGGRIVVPEFQRDYVWKPSKAPKLIESLYRNYPVSSLLLWDGAERVEARSQGLGSKDFLGWLIDGQQRVTTLARAITADPDTEVVFNIETEEFSRTNAANRQDARWVRVSDVWNDEWFRHFRRDLSDTPEDRRAEIRVERLREALDYEIPVVRMVGHKFDEAVEAFTRINSQGVRLSTADLDSARVAAKHAGFIRANLIPLLNDLRKRGFDRLFATHLFRACAFVAHPDGRNRTPLYELPTAEVETAWSRTCDAVNKALDLCAEEFAIGDMSILRSGNLLVPVIALCSLNEGEVERREIAGWIAVASLCRRYGKSASSTIEQDLKACRNADPVGALLRNLKQRRPYLSSGEEDFNGSVADGSGMLTTYIACSHLGAADLATGQRLTAVRVDKHQIFPRSLFPSGDGRQGADVLANVAFTANGSSPAKGHLLPAAYLSRIDPAVLESQAIPLDPKLWRIERAEEFWRERRRLLAAAFNDYLLSALPDRRIHGTGLAMRA